VGEDQSVSEEKDKTGFGKTRQGEADGGGFSDGEYVSGGVRIWDDRVNARDVPIKRVRRRKGAQNLLPDHFKRRGTVMVNEKLLRKAIDEHDEIEENAYPTACFNASGARSQGVSLVVHAPGNDIEGEENGDWYSLTFDPDEEGAGQPIQKCRNHDSAIRATLRAWNTAHLQFSKTPIFGDLRKAIPLPSWDGGVEG
jgi:hypothetical protein